MYAEAVPLYGDRTVVWMRGSAAAASLQPAIISAAVDLQMSTVQQHVDVFRCCDVPPHRLRQAVLCRSCWLYSHVDMLTIALWCSVASC
jgi:hypothetical protein